MAQSRLEKIGTIYSRVTGLYKSGAIKQEQLPLWYPIYEAFPPKYEPRWDRQSEVKPLVKIIYTEDVVRAKFYRQFGEWELVDLFSEKPPTSQLFVDKYLAIAGTGGFSEDEVWDRTVSQLESEGVLLKGSSAVTATAKNNDNKSKQLSFKDLFKEG